MMKKLFYIITLSFFILSCEINYHESNESEGGLTDKQREFAQMILDDSAAISTNWENTLNFKVTFDTDILVKKEDNDNYLLSAMMLADGIAEKGFEYTGKDICVYIYNKPNPEYIQRTCLKNNGF